MYSLHYLALLFFLALSMNAGGKLTQASGTKLKAMQSFAL
jgi:hypothetical protein